MRNALPPTAAALLGAARGRGLSGNTAVELLSDAMPYLSDADRDGVARILAARDVAADIAGVERRVYDLKKTNLRAPADADERLSGLVDVLSHYSDRESEEKLSAVKRAVDMRRRVNRMKTCKSGAEALGCLMPDNPMLSLIAMLGETSGAKASPAGNPDPMSLLSVLGGLGGAGAASNAGGGMDPALLMSLLGGMGGAGGGGGMNPAALMAMLGGLGGK